MGISQNVHFCQVDFSWENYSRYLSNSGTVGRPGVEAGQIPLRTMSALLV